MIRQKKEQALNSQDKTTSLWAGSRPAASSSTCNPTLSNGSTGDPDSRRQSSASTSDGDGRYVVVSVRDSMSDSDSSSRRSSGAVPPPANFAAHVSSGLSRSSSGSSISDPFSPNLLPYSSAQQNVPLTGISERTGVVGNPQILTNVQNVAGTTYPGTLHNIMPTANMSGVQSSVYSGTPNNNQGVGINGDAANTQGTAFFGNGSVNTGFVMNDPNQLMYSGGVFFPPGMATLPPGYDPSLLYQHHVLSPDVLAASLGETLSLTQSQVSPTTLDLLQMQNPALRQSLNLAQGQPLSQSLNIPQTQTLAHTLNIQQTQPLSQSLNIPQTQSLAHTLNIQQTQPLSQSLNIPLGQPSAQNINIPQSQPLPQSLHIPQGQPLAQNIPQSQSLAQSSHFTQNQLLAQNLNLIQNQPLPQTMPPISQNQPLPQPVLSLSQNQFVPSSSNMVQSSFTLNQAPTVSESQTDSQIPYSQEHEEMPKPVPHLGHSFAVLSAAVAANQSRLSSTAQSPTSPLYSPALVSPQLLPMASTSGLPPSLTGLPLPKAKDSLSDALSEKDFSKQALNSSIDTGDATSGMGSSIPSTPTDSSPTSHYSDCPPLTPGEDGQGPKMKAVPCYKPPPLNKALCMRCGKKVYAMEKIGPVKDVLYHKTCFTCSVCHTLLNLKTFHHNDLDMKDHNVYCASHKPTARANNVDSNTVGIQRALTVPRIERVNEQIRGGPEAKSVHLDSSSVSIRSALHAPAPDLQASNKQRESAWFREERKHEGMPPQEVARYDGKSQKYEGSRSIYSS